MRPFCGALIICLLGVAAGRAELPAPRLDRIVPLGGAAGSTLELEVKGSDLEDLSALRFAHAGITAEPIADKEKWFRITIAADCPAGIYDVWTVGRFGISSPRLFSVSHGLREVAEAEPNNLPEQAGEVTLNVAVNGQSDGNNQDIFRFHAEKDQRIVLSCQAGLLDSDLDAVMALTTHDGKPIAASSDYYGRDPLIDFIAAETADYLVAVNDLSYRGGHPYRLLISTQPHVENVYPRAVRAGESTELTVYGRNLGGSAKPSSLAVEGLALEQLTLTVAPPDSISARGQYLFAAHPTDHTVLPTAATCTVTGWQPLLALGDVSALGAPLLVTDHSPLVEQEPNDSAEAPQSIHLPAVVSGRFDQERDADWFQFEVPENGSYEFNVYCERIAGRADPYLVIMDNEGRRITEHDDYGHRVNAFDGHLRDPWGITNLNGGKTYRAMVQDRYGRGGARYQYVMTIERCRGDFYAAAIHSDRQNPAGPTLRRGGATHFDIVIHQRGEYRGPVTITAENLPPGVHAQPTPITNTNRGVFVVWADHDAPPSVTPIRLVAEGIDGDRKFLRDVRAYTRVTNQGGSRPVQELPLTVIDQSPFMLRLEPPAVEAVPGEKLKLKLVLQRHWPEFKADVNILSEPFPNNFKLGNQKLSGGEAAIELEIEVQANTSPGEYSLAVIGQAQVPFHKDPQATDRPNTLVSLPSTPATVRVREIEK